MNQAYTVSPLQEDLQEDSVEVPVTSVSSFSKFSPFRGMPEFSINMEEVPPHPNTHCELMLITPDIARWIKENRRIRNRKIKMAHVRMLEKAMTSGRFYSTNQGVAFDTEGNYVDGYHRIEAIIRSNTSHYIWVFFNLSPEAVKALDVNQKRSYADFMDMKGEGDTANKQAATKLIVASEYIWRRMGNNGSINTVARMSTQADIFELDEEREEIDAYVDFTEDTRIAGRVYSSARPISKAAVIAFLYLATKYHERELAEKFIDRVKTGNNVGDNDPAYWMRHKAEKLAQGRKEENIKPRKEDWLMWLIVAYTFVAKDKPRRTYLELPKNNRFPAIPGFPLPQEGSGTKSE